MSWCREFRQRGHMKALKAHLGLTRMVSMTGTWWMMVEEVEHEVIRVVSNQITFSLLGLCREFRFWSKTVGKPLETFK